MRATPSLLNQSQLHTFYGMSVYSILDMPRSSLLNNVKKLAPDVSLETCSKNEVRIFSKLPKFTPMKSSKTEYDLFIPNSETLVCFNSRFESGNL